jgi:hypothetical protein
VTPVDSLGAVLNHLVAVIIYTLEGLGTVTIRAAHGDLASIGALLWLVIVARVVLVLPHRGRRRRVPRRERHPFLETTPTRRFEAAPAPPKTLLIRPAGHTVRCTCSTCIPPARPALPAPSGRVEPGPCRHELIARVAAPGGELWRYTCANWRCATVWPPDTEWPPGTRFTEED